MVAPWVGAVDSLPQGEGEYSLPFAPPTFTSEV
jgi:hypothetical protein